MISSPADTLFSVVSAPVFLFVGHGVGQNAILVFCLRRARHSHAALTEYAELGKMRSGAARTAGGYGYTPAKGVLLMRITLHIGRFTVTIIVKSRNRHSAK